MSKKRAAAFSPGALSKTQLLWLLHNEPALGKVLRKLKLRLTATGRLVAFRTPLPMSSGGKTAAGECIVKVTPTLRGPIPMTGTCSPPDVKVRPTPVPPLSNMIVRFRRAR